VRLENLAWFRQLAYRLFSSTLLYPDAGRLEALATAAAGVRKLGHEVSRFPFFLPWQRLLGLLADPPRHPSLGEAYVRVFLHNPERNPCLLHESAYVAPGGHATGWVLALLEREYAALGLALPSSSESEPDHVAVELEFMAFLCSREADAWEARSVGEGTRCLKRQLAFLDRHLTRWVPLWAHGVAASGGEGFYPAVAEAVEAFVTHDRDLVRVLLDERRKAPRMPYRGSCADGR
jgi:TorA maturation chaperone TorD